MWRLVRALPGWRMARLSFGSPREPDVDVGSRMISTTKAPGLPARPLLGTRNVTNVHVREHERQVLRGVDQLAHFRIRQCRGGADAPYLRAGNLGQIAHGCGGGNRNPHRHNTDEPSQRRGPSKLRTGVLRHDDAEFVCTGEIAGHLAAHASIAARNPWLLRLLASARRSAPRALRSQADRLC